jgi:imidazolonepropionase-like amidohydrolase/Tol biopolymer transport system component
MSTRPRHVAAVVAAALSVAVLATTLPAQRGGNPRDPMQEGLPLKPTRTMTFTTREAHWTSVDVSPDGQTLVFDVLGDIYTMPISGGKATALTRGMGFDAQPRFSPDGKKVVYVSDRDGGYNLYTLSLDKKDTVQLTTGKTNRYYSPTFTPDGKYVIATKGQRLFIYDVEGGTGEELVRAEPNAPAAGGRGGAAAADALRQMGAAFGKDPRYVWFAQRRGSFMYNTPLTDYSLAVYDRESGQTSTRESRWGSAFRPVLSPDGKWLVYGTRYISETRLRIRDLKSGDEKWLVYPVQRDDQESAASLDVYPGMAFTPDSRWLITTWDGKLWKVPVPTGNPVEIPFEVDVVQPLGPAVRFDYAIPDSSTFVVKQIRDAAPSPDGRKLAFVSMDRLYVMDYPNGTPRRVTNSGAGEFEPSWSADGQWITYSTWSGPQGGHVFKTRGDGSGQPQRLTTVSSYWQHPVFTPDGRRIVAVRGPARAFNLALAQATPGGAEDFVWIPANGGEATFIAAAAGADQPQFTRDTTRIFAYSGARGLYSMRWDGTDVRSILRVAEGGGRADGGGGGGGGSVTGVFISPDGSQALAQSSSLDLYVMSIPVLGGAAPQITLGDVSTFPNRKITDIGAQFPVWAADGRSIHWSIGNAHVVYDLERARVFDDSMRRANRATQANQPANPQPDTAAAGGRGDGRGRAPAPQFRPSETRIRITADRDIPKGVTVLRGARVVTMKGNEVIENADIVVTNNRISAIGKRGSVAIPSGAHTVDVGGKTIIPGFVDTHAHLRVASNIHRDVQWSYAVNLAYGVTTARDPQTGATDVLSFEDEVRAGNVVGPRIYSTGPGVFAYSGIRDLESARRVLRRYSDYYDTKTIKEYETGNREVRQWVIQAANELHLMPTTEGGLDYPMNITEAIDGYSGHEHTIPTYPLHNDVIKLLVESGISYTPTLLVAYGGPWSENYWYEHEDPFNETKLRHFTPWNDLDAKLFRRGGTNSAAPNGAQAGWFADNQYIMKIAGEDLKRLVDAGGRVGIGSHGQLQGLGYHWELWSVAMGGMTAHEALRVATATGADALGLGKEIGSLEVGKQADMLVLDKNPLENIRNSKSIHFVMKNGRLYDANTLDEVWPRQKKFGSFYWQDDEGGTMVSPSTPARTP